MELWTTLKRNRSLVAIAALILLCASYLLYDDRWMTGSASSSGPSIGVIQAQENDARHKGNNSLIWYKAQQSENVHLGDSVFSGEHSSMQIALRKGGDLTIGENSLVVFREIENQTLANLSGGNFNLKVDGEVKIAINGELTTFTGKNAQVQVFVGPDHKAQVRLMKGLVRVENKSKATELWDARVLALDPPAEEPAVPTVVAQAESIRYVWRLYDLYQKSGLGLDEIEPPSAVNAEASLELSKSAAPQFLEVSQSPDFAKPTQLKTETGTLTVSPLFIGENYWHTSYDQKNWSLPHKITVRTSFLKESTPELSKDFVSIAFHSTPVIYPIHMRSSRPAEGYVAEAATSDEFKKGEMHTFWNVSEQLNVVFYHPGKYFYRFRAVNEKQQLSEWSKTMAFDVYAPEPPPVPRLARTHKKVLKKATTAIAKQKPEPKQPARQTASVDSTVSLAVDMPPPPRPNENYKSSLVAIEGFFWKMQSSQQYYQDQSAEAAAGLGVRGMTWWDHSGVEGLFKAGVLSLGGADTSLKDAEARYHYRFFTPGLFGLVREFQISVFAGYEYFADTSSLLSSQYELVTFGTSIEFPVASHWNVGGELSGGYGFDGSQKEEASAHVDYFIEKNWSLGLGYRLHLFQAGSASAAPGGYLPYREGYTEEYTLLNYHF